MCAHASGKLQKTNNQMPTEQCIFHHGELNTKSYTIGSSKRKNFKKRFFHFQRKLNSPFSMTRRKGRFNWIYRALQFQLSGRHDGTWRLIARFHFRFVWMELGGEKRWKARESGTGYSRSSFEAQHFSFRHFSLPGIVLQWMLKLLVTMSKCGCENALLASKTLSSVSTWVMNGCHW